MGVVPILPPSESICEAKSPIVKHQDISLAAQCDSAASLSAHASDGLRPIGIMMPLGKMTFLKSIDVDEIQNLAVTEMR